jgi:UDP-2,3-diacylglucosamine hydrolase
MATYFISDLHLSPEQPELAEKFYYFLSNIAKYGDALYILGDFFSMWIGDDNNHPFYRQVINTLNQFTQEGLNIYIMHGNRDFLLDQQFCHESGCQLLADPCYIKIYDKLAVICHGDTLCLEDTGYLRFRKIIRNDMLKWLYLKLPLRLRQRIADGVKRQADPLRMDVTAAQDAINQITDSYRIKLLIHGHTHRPTIEYHPKTEFKRIVLSDWDTEGHYLQYLESGEMRNRYF